jgi:4-hydroxybenzoate polyprenyltransferase
MAIGVGVYNQVLIKNREPKFCITAFKNNQYVGLLIFLGIYGEYLL